MLVELSKYHDEWLDIAYSFLNNKQDAEDIVQDMYLRYATNPNLIKRDKRYVVNKYYVYLTIRSICLDSIKKKKPDVKGVDYIEQMEVVDDDYMECDILKEIDKEMQSWSWYDRTIFEIYMYTELSLRDLAYGSDKKPRMIAYNKKICETSVLNGANISLSSIFNTIKACKQRLRYAITPNTKNEI